MSQTTFHQVWITKSKVIHVQNPVPKLGKTKKWKKKISGLQNGAIRGLQIEAGFKDYKLGQEVLQIVAALRISNLGKKITNRGRDFKLGQQGFQIGAGITNRGRNSNRCRTMEISIKGVYIWILKINEIVL